MFESELNELLHEIVQTVTNIIPVDWEDIYLNSEVSAGDGEVLFYFNTAETPTEYIYSHDIPSKYNLSLSEYLDSFNKLMDISRAILKILKDNEQPLWTNMIISIKHREKMKVEFDYTNWLASPFSINQRLNYFRYKYLNIVPRDEQELKLFQEMENYQKQFNKS